MEERITYRCYLLSVLLICLANICKASDISVEPKLTLQQKFDFCDAVSFVKTSSYLSRCSKLTYTTAFNDEDKDLAMCMVAYDIVNKICAYNSLTSDGSNLNVPVSSQLFDDQLRKLELKPDKSDEFIKKFCKNRTAIFNRLDNIGIDSNSDVIPFIKYVKDTLLQPSECTFTCHAVKNRVNSLCIFFWWADELFTNAKPISIKTQDQETLSNKQPLATVSDIQKQTIQQNTRTIIIDSKKEIISKSNDEPPRAMDNNSSNHSVNKTLPTTDVKKEEPKKQPVDISSNNKVVEEPKDSKVENSGDDVKDELIPVNNDKMSSVASKVVDNEAENINIAQPEKANPEDFNLAEEPLNKKADDPDIDDTNAHDSADDKDPINDGSFASNNVGNIAEILDSKKSYAPEDESDFFTYFSVLSLICVGLYVGYHSKQKILALVLEGRRSRRGRGSRRRPSTATYRKLDSNLEEAVTSQCNSDVTHVIY